MLLIDKMKSYVEGLDIEIKMVPPKDNFESTIRKEKAKLFEDENIPFTLKGKIPS